jgi:hypothetical protein
MTGTRCLLFSEVLGAFPLLFDSLIIRDFTRGALGDKGVHKVLPHRSKPVLGRDFLLL